MIDQLKNYAVTLYDINELESFYYDMETPGGALYIPNRRVDVYDRRPGSSVTVYKLTEQEAMDLRNDVRVKDVSLNPENDPGLVDELYSWSQSSNQWYKGENTAANQNDQNYGILRVAEGVDRPHHVYTEVPIPNTVQTYNLRTPAILHSEYSGEFVDVVIIDGHFNPNHPEFAYEPDGSGGSRVIQRNWFSRNVALGYSLVNGIYPYDDSTYIGDNGNHGHHVAGIVAGNTKGYARRSNIYNIGSVTRTVVPDNIANYLRDWHSVVKPLEGNPNATVANWSGGRSILKPILDIEYIHFRGMNYYPPYTASLLYSLNIHDNFFDVGLTAIKFPFSPISTQAEIDLAIAAGIVWVTAAGNSSSYMVPNGHIDYNNYVKFFSSITNYYYQRRGAWAGDNSIVVGSIDARILPGPKTAKVATYTVRGPGIDIFAHGTNIISAVGGKGAFTVSDPRNSSYHLDVYDGTSMAAPQVAGVACLILSQNPLLTPAQVKAKLIADAATDQIIDTLYRDETQWFPGTLDSSPNLILKSDLVKSEYSVSSPYFTVTGSSNCIDFTVPADAIFGDATYRLTLSTGDQIEIVVTDTTPVPTPTPVPSQSPVPFTPPTVVISTTTTCLGDSSTANIIATFSTEVELYDPGSVIAEFAKGSLNIIEYQSLPIVNGNSSWFFKVNKVGIPYAILEEGVSVMTPSSSLSILATYDNTLGGSPGDDSVINVTLPFPISFPKSLTEMISDTRITVGTNSFISLGTYTGRGHPVSLIDPPFPSIFIGARDTGMFNLYGGSLDGNNSYILRWEGVSYFSQGTSIADLDRIWEVVFYKNTPSIFTIKIDHNYWDSVTLGSTYIKNESTQLFPTDNGNFSLVKGRYITLGSSYSAQIPIGSFRSVIGSLTNSAPSNRLIIPRCGTEYNVSFIIEEYQWIGAVGTLIATSIDISQPINIHVGNSYIFKILDGPPNKTVTIKKVSSIENFFGVGYLPNTEITLLANQLDQFGLYYSAMDGPLTVQGTASIDIEFTEDFWYSITNGPQRSIILNVIP